MEKMQNDSGCKGLKAQRSTVESGRNIDYIL